MEKSFIQQLEQLGLTADEAVVYLALLEIGTSSVTPLSSVAKINRTSCYAILQTLTDKRLVSKSLQRGKQYFAPADPTRFDEILAEKQRKLDIWETRVRAIEEEFCKVYMKQVNRPNMKYVEGIEGLIALYEDSLTCQDPEGIRTYTCVNKLTEVLSTYSRNYFERRARRGIKARVIAPDTPEGRVLKKLEREHFREIRLVPPEEFDFSPEIYLYDNKFSVMSFNEKFGFMVESQETVDALKRAWDLAWEWAESYDKKVIV